MDSMSINSEWGLNEFDEVHKRQSSTRGQQCVPGHCNVMRSSWSQSTRHWMCIDCKVLELGLSSTKLPHMFGPKIADLRPHATISSCYDLSDNCFSFTSMLADAMRSMDVSCSPASLVSCSHFLYHVPPARVLVRFPFRFKCCLTCMNVDCRLVSGYLFSLCFPFMFCRLVHLCFWLMPFSLCSLSTHLLTR